MAERRGGASGTAVWCVVHQPTFCRHAWGGVGRPIPSPAKEARKAGGMLRPSTPPPPRLQHAAGPHTQAAHLDHAPRAAAERRHGGPVGPRGLDRKGLQAGRVHQVQQVRVHELADAAAGALLGGLRNQLGDVIGLAGVAK